MYTLFPIRCCPWRMWVKIDRNKRTTVQWRHLVSQYESKLNIIDFFSFQRRKPTHAKFNVDAPSCSSVFKSTKGEYLLNTDHCYRMWLSLKTFRETLLRPTKFENSQHQSKNKYALTILMH